MEWLLLWLEKYYSKIYPRIGLPLGTWDVGKIAPVNIWVLFVFQTMFTAIQWELYDMSYKCSFCWFTTLRSPISAFSNSMQGNIVLQRKFTMNSESGKTFIHLSHVSTILPMQSARRCSPTKKSWLMIFRLQYLNDRGWMLKTLPIIVLGIIVLLAGFSTVKCYHVLLYSSNRVRWHLFNKLMGLSTFRTRMAISQSLSLCNWSKVLPWWGSWQIIVRYTRTRDFGHTLLETAVTRRESRSL